MSAPTVFDHALGLLDGRFTNDPKDRRRKDEPKKEYLTAYAAVKLAFGVKRDDHAVAYNGSKWPELAATLASTFDALDEIVAESSERPVPFTVWCSRPERIQREVEVVLQEAARRHPEMTVAQQARLRPHLPGFGTAHKLRWVVCSQLAMIASGRATTVGSVIELIRPIDESNDWELVERLDCIIDDEAVPWERPKGANAAVALSRAWGIKTRSAPTYSLTDFLDDFEAGGGIVSSDDGVFSEALERFTEAHKDEEAPDYSAPRLK